MKSRIVLIYPIFKSKGKNADTDFFRLWAKTAKWNKEIDFVIISDQFSDPFWISFSPNIKFVKMMFSEYIDRISNSIGFTVSNQNSVSSCQFRPALGLSFPDIVEGYDFWGYGDNDVLLGHITDFINDEKLAKYDALFCFGHFRLFKNSIDNNRIFLNSKPLSEKERYSSTKSVFQGNCIFCFDEGPISRLFLAAGKKLYIDNNAFFDVNMYSLPFIPAQGNRSKASPFYFLWDKGKLYCVCTGQKEARAEIMYAHFQKRKIVVEGDLMSDTSFLVIPNRAIRNGLLSKTDIQRICISQDASYFSAQEKLMHKFNLKNRLRKLLAMLCRKL
jgi:hypothetical protein